MSLEKGITRVAFEVEEPLTPEEMAFVTRVLDKLEGIRRGEVMSISVDTMNVANKYGHVFFDHLSISAKENGR